MSEASAHPFPKPSGLQAERTSLAWSRTSLALAGNGVLVLLRHEAEFPRAVAIALGGFAGATAAMVIVFSRRRRHALLRQPTTEIGSNRGMVMALGTATVLLCAATSVALLT